MLTEVYPASSGSLNWLRVLALRLLWVAIGLLAVYLAGLALYLAVVLPYPYTTHFEEGVILGSAMNLVQGGALYSDNLSPPYASILYTPLHYVIFTVPLAVFGPSLVGPRVISLVGTGLIALLIYRWVGHHTEDRRAQFIAAGIVLTFFPVANWTAAARADTVAVFLSMAGAYVVERHYQDRKLWLAIPLMVLAFYTKQTQIAAPLAAGLFLLGVSPRRAIRFGIAYLIAVGGAFLLVDRITHHGLYRHVIDYARADSPIMQRGKLMYKAYFLQYPVYLLLAFGGAVALLRKARFPFLAFYLVTSFIGSASAFGAQSDFNHFMENAAVLSVLAGIGIGRALSSARPYLPAGAAALLALQLAFRVPSVVPGLAVPWLPIPGTRGRGNTVSEPPLWMGMPNQQDRATGDRLVAEFARAHGPVLSELSAFPLQAGRRSELDDMGVFVALHAAGKWNQDAVVAQLDAGQIDPIVLLVDVRPAGIHHTRLTDEMIAAIRAHYRLMEMLPYPGLDGPWVYVYRPVTSGGH